MSRVAAFVLAGLVVVPTGAARGQDFDREAAFLTIPTGARVVGLGRAATALAGEVQALSWNPAVLARVDRLTPLASHYEGPLDFQVNQLAVALPLRSLGQIAFSVNVQDFGEIQLSDARSPDGSLGEVAPKNLVVAASYSRRLVSPLALGVTAKWIRSDLVAELTGSTVAFDAGLLLHPIEAVPFDLGLAVLNLGPALRVGQGDGGESPLPSRLRVGSSYDLLSHLRPGGALRLRIAADLEHALRDLETGSQYLGAELAIRDLLMLRAGWVAETLIETNSGGTVGLGVGLGAIQFDLAREIGVNQLGDETHITLSARL